jgi:hypothetical protein
MTHKNQIFTFDGLRSIDITSGLDSMIDFKGNFSVNKKGFFKDGNIDGEEGYKILGHVRRNVNAYNTRLAFILTIDDYAHPEKIFSLFSYETRNLEGTYIGGWYVNAHQLNPELFRDYNKFMEFVDSSGSIGGYAEMTLKKKC